MPPSTVPFFTAHYVTQTPIETVIPPVYRWISILNTFLLGASRKHAYSNALRASLLSISYKQYLFNPHLCWFDWSTLHRFDLSSWHFYNLFVMLAPFHISGSFLVLHPNLVTYFAPHFCIPAHLCSNPPRTRIQQSRVKWGFAYFSLFIPSGSTQCHPAAINSSSSGVSPLLWLLSLGTYLFSSYTFDVCPLTRPHNSSQLTQVFARSVAPLSFSLRTVKPVFPFTISHSSKGSQQTDSLINAAHNFFYSILLCVIKRSMRFLFGSYK